MDFESIASKLKLGVPGKVIRKADGKVAYADCRWMMQANKNFLVVEDGGLTEWLSPIDYQFIPTEFEGETGNGKEKVVVCAEYRGDDAFPYWTINERGEGDRYIKVTVTEQPAPLSSGQEITIETTDGQKIKAVIK